MIYKILLFVGVIFNVLAQLLLKYSVKDINLKVNILRSLTKGIIFNPYVWCSLLLYGISFIIYSIVLTKLELSKSYPIASVAAILCIYIFSVLLFNESISIQKTLGILLSILGITLILI